MLHTISISNKCYFELSVHQNILKNMFRVFTKIFSIMTSEGSCDTEDWSNGF